MFPLSPVIIFFLIISGAYFLLIILVMAGLTRQRLLTVPGSPFRTKVTVIIPARDEERNIIFCLNDLLRQHYPAGLMEVILVDDGSADRTFFHADNFIEEHPEFPLTVLTADPNDNLRGSKKRAISAAILHSTGELIITTDADTRFGEKWIASMVSCYEQLHPEMILGPVAYNDGNSWFARIQSVEFMGLMAVTDGSCAMGRPLMCNGANLAYTRKAFDLVGGFDDNMKFPSGDDMFLMQKIRRKFGRRSVQYNRSWESVVRTDPNKTAGDFIQQRLRWVSKSKGYKDVLVLMVAMITYLFNAILLVGLIAGFFISYFWTLAILLFAIKLILELPVLYRYAVFLKMTRNMTLVPVVQVLNIFYVVIIGVLGNFVAYKWKGRSVSPTK